MTSVFQRSKSNRSLTIDDSFHREQQQQRWAMGKRNSSRRLVRSNSVSSDYARAAGTMPPSSSSAALSKQRGKGKQMLRSVVGFLSRTKSGKGKNAKGSFTMTEPASPASASSSSLSRTNSDSSAHGAGRESDSGQIAAGGPGSTSRPRVSFDAVVQTVYIEQMKEEEVRSTFYCRTEYAAFKEAYRVHRDTSSDWCRSNDVLPCNCDACQDDLVQGGHHDHHISSSSSSSSSAPAPAALSPDHDNYDSAFDAPQPPPSPYALGHKDKSDVGEAEEENSDNDLPSPYAYGHKKADNGGAEAGEGAQEHHEPPSPVGAVFQDTQGDTSSGGSGSSCFGSNSSTGSGSSRDSRATTRKCPSARYSSARRHSAAHRRRGTWGVGSVPIASPVGRAHKRGGSLDDWGVSSSVQEAVKCHGEGYAYKTLRLQGFSDLYIRTHFLPEG